MKKNEKFGKKVKKIEKLRGEGDNSFTRKQSVT